MSDPMTKQIVEFLVENGPMTSSEISQHLDIPNRNISDVLRRLRSRETWGVYVLSKVDSCGRGQFNLNLWAVDIDKLNKFLLTHTHRRAKGSGSQRKIDRQKKKGIEEVVVKQIKKIRAVYTGPILTRWQPSSPYYVEKHA